MKTLTILLIVSAICIDELFADRQQKEHGWKQRFEKTWPNSDDLKWFQKAKGMTKKEVLSNYGPPLEKTIMEGGRLQWRYSWLASAHIVFKNGKVEYVFYTAGY